MQQRWSAICLLLERKPLAKQAHQIAPGSARGEISVNTALRPAHADRK